MLSRKGYCPPNYSYKFQLSSHIFLKVANLQGINKTFIFKIVLLRLIDLLDHHSRYFLNDKSAREDNPVKGYFDSVCLNVFKVVGDYVIA